MAKYLRKRKNPVLLWILPVLLLTALGFFFLRMNSGKGPVCKDYVLTLPEGMVLQNKDKTQDSLI